MADERNKRVDSKGTVIGDHNRVKKKKKREKESADGEKLGEDIVVKKISKKKGVDSEFESDGKESKKRKKSKKKNCGDESESLKVCVGDEENQGQGKPLVDTDCDLGAEENTEKKMKSKNDTKISKKKGKKKIGENESQSLRVGSEQNQGEEKPLVNTDDGKEKTGKRKRDDSDLGAQESTEVKRKSKTKKKSSVEDAKKKQNSSKGADDDGTTSSSKKATKKVKFSDQNEVFLLEDPETEEEDEEVEETEEEEEDEELEEKIKLVRGKRFTKEEDELVKQAVLEYIDNHALGDEGLKMILECKAYPQLKGCWKEIASAIPWRPLDSVYNRAHTLFEEGSSRGVWTEEDYELLKEYQKKHGHDWRTLGDAMGKNRRHVKDAWRRIRLAEKKKGHWSREEYQQLFDLVNKDIKMKAFQKKRSKHGMIRDNIPWMAVSDQLRTRDHVVCCVKWYDQLTSPMVKKGIWDNVDDYRLLDELTKLDAACIDDVDWDNLLENRDGEACRKRWNQMVHHIGSPATKTFAEQVEILSERYCPDLAEDREDFDNRPYDSEDSD